jgi:hypothetical protein
MRRKFKDLLAYIDKLATPRGASAPLPKAAEELRARFFKHLAPAVEETGHQMMENAREFIATYNAQRRDEAGYKAGLTVLAALCDESMNYAATASFLGVDWRTVKRAAALRDALRHAPLFPLRGNGGARRAVPLHVRLLAQTFWDENTRASPLRRDSGIREGVPRWIFNNGIVKEPRGVHLQDRPDLHMYALFVEQHGPLVSARSFCTYGLCKPEWVKRLKHRFVCLSESDVQLELYIDALRTLAQRLEKLPKTCDCAADAPGCAMNIAAVLQHPGKLRNAVLCPKTLPDEPYHNSVCLHGKCALCGWKRKLGSCSMLNAGVPDASWRQYQKIDEPAMGSHETGRRKLVEVRHVSQPRKELLTRIRTHFAEWLMFDFRGRWQMSSIKRHVTDLPPGTVLVTMDYAADFTIEKREELHKESMQGLPHIKILVAVTWRRTAAGEVVREDFFWLYDGRGHKAGWDVIEHAVDQLRQHFSAHGINRVVCCIDNCAAQFKCCSAFLGMSNLQHRWGISCRLEWIYGGAERFKWVHDTAGGWVKHTLRTEVLHFATVEQPAVENAASAVRFLDSVQVMVGPSARVHGRHFFELDEATVQRLKRNASRSVSTVEGTRAIHAIRPCPEVPGRLYARDLGCGCAACVVGDFAAEQCKNADYVSGWRAVVVEPCASAPDPDDEDEPDAVIEVGSVVAIPSNLDSDDGDELPFFLLEITKASHYLTAPVSNDARKRGKQPLTFAVGERVLEARWLQQCAKPQGGDLLFERWDDDWASQSTGKWAGGKPPWKDVPLVIIRWDEVESTHVKVQPATQADCRGVDRAAHPGTLFTLPRDELAAIMSEFDM